MLHVSYKYNLGNIICNHLRERWYLVTNDYLTAKWGLDCLSPGSLALASRAAPLLYFLNMSAQEWLESPSRFLAEDEAHRQDLTEEQRVDGVDPPINGCAKGSEEHVGPLGSIVLQDPGHWSRLNKFLLLRDGVLGVHTEKHTHQWARLCV